MSNNSDAGALQPEAVKPVASTGVERGPRGGVFRILKPGQGIHVRWGTAVGAGVLALAGAQWVYEQSQAFRFMQDNYYARTLLPVALLLVVLYLIFWVVGRNATVVDFMIVTEGEMKKVNWSTRKEVWGATRVVIVTVLALGLLLAVVDALFIAFFGGIGVLKNVRLMDIIFSTGET